MKLRGQIILCESLNLQGADLQGTTFEMSMSKHSMEAQTFSPFFGRSHLFAFPSVSSREKPSERKPQSQGALHAQAKLLFSHQAFNKAFKILLIIILPLSIAPNTTDFRDSSV